MKFHLNKFKKIHSDKSMTVLQHEDGHEIKVAHQHLSPKMRGEIEAMPMHASDKEMGASNMPHLAEGGMLPEDFNQRVQQEAHNLAVTDTAMPPMNMDNSNIMPKTAFPMQPEMFQTEAETNVAKNVLDERQKKAEMDTRLYQDQMAKTQQANMIRQQMGLNPLPSPVPPVDMIKEAQGMQQVSMPRQDQQMQPQQGMQDPYGTEEYSKNYMQGIGEQKKGINLQAQTEGQIGQQQAKALEQNIQQTEDLNTMFQNNHSLLQKERDSLMNDLKAQHINPNQLWEDKSAVGKVSTAVGLILGGMGGGVTGQENPALKLLNHQIERNIEAQKLNMGNKFNLLNANRQQFQDERSATEMTRVMMNDVVSNQLKLAAAKSADPMARARALQAAGQLDMQAAPIMSQIAMRKAVLNGAKQGSIDPSMAIRVVVPEHQQASAYKELQEAQLMNKAKDNILGSFDKLSQLNTVGNRVSSPIQSASQVAAIRDPLIAGLSKETAGRFTESDAKMVGALFPNATDSTKTIAVKRQQLMKLVSEKMNSPVLNSYGINPGNMSRFNNSGASKIQESPVRPVSGTR